MFFPALEILHTRSFQEVGEAVRNVPRAVNELAIFEAATLPAPKGEQDELAMTVVIGLAAMWWKSREESGGEGKRMMVEEMH